MQEKDYVVFSGHAKGPEIKAVPAGAEVRVAVLDQSAIEGCIFTMTGWYTGPLEVPGLRKHDSKEILMLLGSDHDHPESLNAEIEFQIENDVLTLTKTCAIYIPYGAAHGNLKIKKMDRPVFFGVCHTDTDTYREKPAKACAAPGTYVNNFVDRYDTTGIELPNAPEGVMTRLFYLDNARVPDAPYFESVWFNIPAKPFLKAHTHELDEVICFAGADPSRPEELDGHVDFYIEGKPVELKKSCIIYAPRGVSHAPFDIIEMNHPCLHFSGGNNSNYHRA